MNGTIKALNERKFGFIARDDQPGEKDVFFHADKVVGVPFEELKVGDKVTFDVVQGEKGPAAENVTRV